MRIILQCGLCGARDSAQHGSGCQGRKVRVPVYGRADFNAAKEAGYSMRPSNIRCFDNGGRTADRYTLIRTTPVGFYYNETARGRDWFAVYFDISASAAPYHPQGIGITNETQRAPLWNAGKWGSQSGRFAAECGYKPARWSDLPEQVRRCAWGLAIDDDEP